MAVNLPVPCSACLEAGSAPRASTENVLTGVLGLMMANRQAIFASPAQFDVDFDMPRDGDYAEALGIGASLFPDVVGIVSPSKNSHLTQLGHWQSPSLLYMAKHCPLRPKCTAALRDCTLLARLERERLGPRLLA